MSVKVEPLPNGKFRVTIRFRWPDGTVYRERPNVDAPSKAVARKWGEARESEVRAAGKPKAPDAKAVTVAEFAPQWLDKHARANLHKASGIDSKESAPTCKRSGSRVATSTWARRGAR